MSDIPPKDIPADTAEAKTPPPQADPGPPALKLIDDVSGPLAVMGATLKLIGRCDKALSALERVVYARVSKAKAGLTGVIEADEVEDIMHLQVGAVWSELYEAVIVCSFAANDISVLIPALKPEVEKQLTAVDHSLVNGAVKAVVTCHLLGRDIPETLREVDFEDGASLAARHNQDFDQVKQAVEQMNDDQRYRLDIFKLVRAVMTRKTEPLDIQACLLTDAEVAEAEATMQARRAHTCGSECSDEQLQQRPEQVARDSHTED